MEQRLDETIGVFVRPSLDSDSSSDSSSRRTE